MKVLVLLMVCDSDQAIICPTIQQIVDLLSDLDLHFIIYDDASSERLGDKVKDTFEASISGQIHVVRSENSKGFYHIVENIMTMFRYAIRLNEHFDCVLKIDPDLAFTSKGFHDLFTPEYLPQKGIVSTVFKSRLRDYVQFYADLLPLEFRRQRKAGKIGHRWEWAGLRKIWWSNLGFKAFLNGYRGEVAPGCFILLCWETFTAMNEQKYFQMDHRNTGLIFAEDVFITIMVKALDHPLYDLKDIHPNFKSNIFLNEDATIDDIKDEGYYLVHPLEDRPWANALRQDITALRA
jgi:hypothetical protein